MSMADRNNPKRGLASESDYSLMAFTREFPDDAACPTPHRRPDAAPSGAHLAAPLQLLGRTLPDLPAAVDLDQLPLDPTSNTSDS